MCSPRRIAWTLVLGLVACTTSAAPDEPGDSIGEGKSDSAWEPERALDLAGPPLVLDPSSPGHVVRGTLDPSTYGGVTFLAQTNTRVRGFTRTWLGAGVGVGWETQPKLYRFTGAAGADVNEWSNWSRVQWGLIGQLGLDGVYAIKLAGTYLMIVTAESEAYAARADYMIYLSHGEADPARYTTTLAGTVRCGANRTPARGVTLSLGEFAERVTTDASGEFAFAERYPVGRRNLWAQPTSSVDSIVYFDAILAPDDNRVVAILDRCP